MKIEYVATTVVVDVVAADVLHLTTIPCRCYCCYKTRAVALIMAPTGVGAIGFDGPSPVTGFAILCIIMIHLDVIL